MSRIESLLEERFSGVESKKVKQLAHKSSHGELSSAANLFTSRLPTSDEVQAMQTLLERFSTKQNHLQEDAQSLVALTLETKAINHQAALLHGERIKKAQSILKQYQEGAFSVWLVQTYGNRQTPYNFLLYHDLFNELSKHLQQKFEEMPKACAYALAVRTGAIEDKQAVITTLYNSDRKTILEEIQKRFPLAQTDKRKKRWGTHLIREFQKLLSDFKKHEKELSKSEREELKALIQSLYTL